MGVLLIDCTHVHEVRAVLRSEVQIHANPASRADVLSRTPVR